ncbi:MAG: alcohol dehydrogenase catalytic domain-containing protein [Nitrososphaerota archaeon]|nr:alcohol dehydrogenase catalytic domain-containing protein [Nitrososphaerota archaeon]
MRALVFDGETSLRELPTPARDRETLIRVVKAGICGTDLAIAAGDYPVRTPLVLGHEIFGVVEKAPPGMEPGTRVVTEINVSCGACRFCGGGMRTHCSRVQTLGISRDGGFADCVSVPPENLHAVPDGISDECAVFVEPLAAAVELTNMAPVEEGSSCAVVGPGRLGLLMLQVLKLRGASPLVALGRGDSKLALARSLGADRSLKAEEAEQAVEISDGGFDHVVEATGSPEGFSLALRLVRPRGTVHLKSTHGRPASFDMTGAVVRELRIQGSRCGRFEQAIPLLAEGLVRTSELVMHRFGLEGHSEAFRVARSGEAVKVVLSP